MKHFSFTIGTPVLTLLLAFGGIVVEGSAANAATLVAASEVENAQALSLSQYFEKVSKIILTAPEAAAGNYSSAKQSIEAQSNQYYKQFEQLSQIVPPSEVSEVHTELVNAVQQQAIANEQAAARTPNDAPVTNENVNKYAHYTADVGYARADESKAACELQTIATSLGLTFNSLGACGAQNEERTEGKSVGTAEQPVNNISMVHETLPDYEGISRPNLNGFEISSITAIAEQPIIITFDNRNPAPFVFNIAVYSGTDERVKASQYIAGTDAYAGEKVHKLTLTLSPGTYTYVDNVHPTAMRGTLKVVSSADARSVPEPSSILGLLMLGVVGGSFKLGYGKNSD